MSSNTGTTKKEVLLRVHSLLLGALTYWTDYVIIVADDLVPQAKPKLCVTISMTGGQYDYAAQVGGGREAVYYQGTLRVSIWNIKRTDQNGHDKDALLVDDTGLYRMQHRILKTLIGSLLDEANVGTGSILRQEIHALSDTSAQRMDDESTGTKFHGSNSRATISMDFGLDFKIDLDLES